MMRRKKKAVVVQRPRHFDSIAALRDDLTRFLDAVDEGDAETITRLGADLARRVNSDLLRIVGALRLLRHWAAQA